MHVSMWRNIVHVFLAVCPVMSFIRIIIVCKFCIDNNNTFPYGLTIHNFIPLLRSFHDGAVPCVIRLHYTY